MKKEKILLLVGISLVVLVLVVVMINATNSTQNSYKNQLQLMKCTNKAILDRNNCLKEATASYHNCSAGTNLNYYKNGMDFWKFLEQCQKDVLRPFQKTCNDGYNIDIKNCKNPTNSTTAVCGNGICEAGEANFCPACVYGNPACMIACTAGTCPQDCSAAENISG